MKKIALAILFCFAFCAAAFAAPPIARIEISGDFSAPKEQVLNLIPFKEGDPFEPAKLEQAAHYLKEWGVFDKIEIKTETTAQGVAVTFILHQGQIISSIHLTGHYPYIEAKIRKRLNLQTGSTYTEESIDEQKRRINRFFEKEGFYNTTVEVETKAAARENHILLYFHIRKGERIRVAKVIYEGNRSIPDGKLQAFVKPMDIYSERRLKNAINEMIQFYRDLGFLRMKAKVTHQKIDAQGHRAHLKITIGEGPLVKVFYKGKKVYRRKKLKETITLFKEGYFDSIEVKASAKAIKERLRKDGYMSAKVSSKREKINPDLYHITFKITPGPRTFVQKIDFEGNNALSDKKIKKNLLTKEHSITQKGVLDEEELKEDVQVAKEYYQSEGYLKAAVGEPTVLINEKKTSYTVVFPVEEGPLVKVAEMKIIGAEEFPKKDVFKTLKNKEGKPFNEPALPFDLDQVRLFFKSHGYPYVEVAQEIEETGESEAVIVYRVNKGDLAVFGEILFVGDVLTAIEPLEETIAFKTNDPYSEEKIIQAELNLRRLGTFQAVKVEPLGLEEKKKTIPVIVRVEERQPFVLDMEAQFSTDRQYTATMQFANYNSFGWGKQTRLALTGGIEKDRVELSWLDPRFMDSDVQMTVSSWLDYEKRAIDESVQEGGAFAFYRQFRRFGFLGRYRLTKTYVIAGQSTDPDSLRNAVLSEVGLSGSYDKRDSFSDPTKGFFTLIGGRFFNEIGGLRADFVKTRGSLAHYYSPFKRITFSSTLRLDRIQDLIKSASIPQREVLGMGGDDTVRGFKEDQAGPLDTAGRPLGGKTRIIFNEELGFRLNPSFQWALFYDGGTLTDGFNDIDLGTYRHSFGSGLRYITPIGPIRADYGIILDRQPGENFGRFHLTFGYFF